MINAISLESINHRRHLTINDRLVVRRRYIDGRPDAEVDSGVSDALKHEGCLIAIRTVQPDARRQLSELEHVGRDGCLGSAAFW